MCIVNIFNFCYPKIVKYFYASEVKLKFKMCNSQMS